MQLEADFDAVMAVFDNKTVLRKSLKEDCAGVATPLTLLAADGENCCFTRSVVLFHLFMHILPLPHCSWPT